MKKQIMTHDGKQYKIVGKTPGLLLVKRTGFLNFFRPAIALRISPNTKQYLDNARRRNIKIKDIKKI